MKREHCSFKFAGARLRKRWHSSLEVLRCMRITIQRSASVSGKCPIAAMTFGHQQEYFASLVVRSDAPRLRDDSSEFWNGSSSEMSTHLSLATRMTKAVSRL